MGEVIPEEKSVSLSRVPKVLVEAPQLGVEGRRVFRYSLKRLCYGIRLYKLAKKLKLKTTYYSE